MERTETPASHRSFRRVLTLALAAVFAIGALIHWRGDIARLLDSGSPLFLVGLALVIPYLVLFVFLSRRAVHVRLGSDRILRNQVRTLQVLRWTGVSIAVVIGIGMAQPALAGEWDPYWIDAVQRGYPDAMSHAIAMAIHAVMIAGMAAGVTIFLSLWILGTVEIVLCALTLGSPTPSWDARDEEPLPGDIIVKVMGACIHGALSQIKPDWVAGSAGSNRLQAVTELAQSVGTFHLTCGLILFAVWIVWSLLEVVVEVVTW